MHQENQVKMMSNSDDKQERQHQQQLQQTTKSSKGYLIALVQEADCLRAFGSPADNENDCDEILEINGRPIGSNVAEHKQVVGHIQECIKLKNISLRVRKPIPNQTTTNDSGRNSSLLDVFVIGTNAHEQLSKFLKSNNIFGSQQDLLKLTNKMEMLELNGPNQTTVNGNGTFNIISGQSQQQQQQHTSQQQQLPASAQVNLGPTHLYYNHQQQSQQQHQQQHQTQNLRYRNNHKHRELPVDVPDSFVGVAKQSPRYPPPKPHSQISPSMQINNLTSFNNVPASLPYNSNNPNSCPQPTNKQGSSIIQSTAANIMTHNSSLRSSIKLKQLEKSRGGQQHGNYPVGQMQPAINQAFELNEDEMMSVNNLQKQQQNQQQQQALKLEQSMPDLCSIYNRLQRNLNGDFAEASGDAKFAKLLSIYNTIVQTHNKQVRIPHLTSKYATQVDAHGNREPVTFKLSDLLQSVISSLREEVMTKEAVELVQILCKHEVDGVCSAFDRISQSFEFAKSTSQSSSSPISDTTLTDDNINLHQQSYQLGNHQQETVMYPYRSQQDDYNYTPDQVQMDIENNLFQNSLLPSTDIGPSDGTCTRQVCIQKNSSQALGATIKNEDGAVVIGRIIHGGAAYESTLLNEGDEILEVNDIPLRGKSVNEVIEILNELDQTLTFRIISRIHKPTQRIRHEKVIVKTFFRYDGENDRYSPCKELGLSFERGEILEIIDQSDSKWWQAKKEGDSQYHLAKLIPSVGFLKEREKETDQEESASAYLKREKKNLVSKLFNCPKGTSPKRRKKFANIPFGPQEIPYYEEITPHYPDKYRKRPIILVGPKMIGQREIWKKLLENKDRFSSAVSHTSRPMQPNERNGTDFYFVSRRQFEADISNGKFIEYGLYQNQYYGTSLEAIREVVRSHKTCVQLVNTPSIFNFRMGPAGTELKPFFVFVKPDDSHPEKLRNTVAMFAQTKSNLEENIKAIVAEVELVETHYLPYFDLVLTVSDAERAYKQLLDEIDKIEREPSWIPMFWKEVVPSSN